jgi:hypothetical protein
VDDLPNKLLAIHVLILNELIGMIIPFQFIVNAHSYSQIIIISV